MGMILKNWLWLPLWAVSMVLILTVPTDSPWLRALMFAPAMASMVLLLLAQRNAR